MIVTRPVSPNEPDLLTGNENAALSVFDLDHSALACFPPPVNGWSHKMLEELANDLNEYFPMGWVACFELDWIGSSEI